MGRPPKTGVDYFPHDVTASSSKTLVTLQEKFGNDGYVFWFKLLEYLGRQKSLYADFSKTNEWQYFVATTKTNVDEAEKIVEELIKMSAIDEPLWRNHKIIWIDNYVDRLSYIYKKRGIDMPSKPKFNDDITYCSTAVTSKQSQKIAYAEYVHMTQNEYVNLIQAIGEPAVKYCIEILDDYKGSSGKEYKDDYRAIRSWVINEARKRNPVLFRKEDSYTEDINPFSEYD